MDQLHVKALALAALLATVGLTGCIAGRDPDEFRRLPDIHALAVHPHDSSVLLVATHNGLMALRNDTEWETISSEPLDLMGFTVHPERPDHMWASGHPPRGGNLGVVQSADGGRTWQPLALPGVDFHAMTVSPADPDRLWGAWQGVMHRSDDGGRTWTRLSDERIPVRGLTAHPTQRDVVFAATGSNLLRSDDAGATWTQHSAAPALSLAFDPADPDVVYAGTEYSVAKSTDGGVEWHALRLRTKLSVGYVAVDPQDPATVYAATYDTAIYKTTDAGATWTTIRDPPQGDIG